MELLQILRRLLQVLTAIHRAYESRVEGRELDNLPLQINESVDKLQMSTARTGVRALRFAGRL